MGNRGELRRIKHRGTTLYRSNKKPGRVKNRGAELEPNRLRESTGIENFIPKKYCQNCLNLFFGVLLPGGPGVVSNKNTRLQTKPEAINKTNGECFLTPRTCFFWSLGRVFFEALDELFLKPRDLFEASGGGRNIIRFWRRTFLF